MWHHVRVVARAVIGQTEKVATGEDCQMDGFLEAVLFDNGTHSEVVGYHYACESHLVAQQLFDH